MPSLAKYFEENRPKPKYRMGDRVHGVWNSIPFRGSVANDSMVSEEEGPKVSIFLDLPILHKNKVYTVIVTDYKSILKSGESFFKGKKK